MEMGETGNELFPITCHEMWGALFPLTFKDVCGVEEGLALNPGWSGLAVTLLGVAKLSVSYRCV
jgi:hypothetical protein